MQKGIQYFAADAAQSIFISKCRKADRLMEIGASAADPPAKSGFSAETRLVAKGAYKALSHAAVTLSRAAQAFSLYFRSATRPTLSWWWWSTWALTVVPGPDSAQNITRAGKSGAARALPPRTLFAPAVLELSLPPDKTCIREAQWLCAPVKPIY